MERKLEPELMDDFAQAEAYASSDWTIPHNNFVMRFAEAFPQFGRTGLVADLGCGTADPAVRFNLFYPRTRLIGIDGSEEMLNFGRRFVENIGLAPRIELRKAMLPDHGLPAKSFDVVISNSLLHHLSNPNVLWRSIIEIAKPKAPIFVMDLTRPVSTKQARKLVALHTENNDPKLMKEDFYRSLLAAFRPEEVRIQLDEIGLDNLKVEVVSDRHMVIHGFAK